VVVAMIEHEEAVRNVEEILSCDGIDAYFVGPYDLSASMGLAGKLDHPRVAAALERVRRAGAAAGVPGGIHVVEPDPAQLKKRARQGFRFLAYGVDMRMIDVASRAGLAAVRKR
jgi:2-dehydro-3-deoxyglucarate aldolase